ncbi:peptide MFS transporter [Pseudorhodoplanes sinuspersici]|uniref:MFS transporter n=1 Tax=Pseudorhodoplanes sinuspersici TaxID=1235591 RepID=A0A1W6ZWU9_9HYPH|nr:peptide MFS transporter [Pseudorhodoplanes sinuspersici]ARQ01611.1 MFS transporter [Pseudorhodoplanes sinuspersici]RKE73325.1 POT family proton-dependent oligopeptide transporter [Pseudorhodoplanes sinuspersici]
MRSAPAGATAPTQQQAVLGHPKGLAFLFATEMWERFSYYGMRSLLVLYMVHYLLLEDRSQNVVGYTTLKSVLEGLFGPLGVQPFSSHIYGLYSAFVYLTPILGGLIADRWLGQRRTVILGAALMAIGHFMMAFETLFLLALVVLILGSGAFKPNISTQVGGLYAPGDRRRDRAFSIFYVGINLGAFLAPLVCGTLGENYGWHYGFTAAGVGMMLGLAIYLIGLPNLPHDRVRLRCDEPRKPLDRDEWRAIMALAMLFLPVTLFWATYEQQGNTIALWANVNTDRSINLLVWRGEIPTTWFQAFNPFMIFAFTPLIVALWSWQAKRNSEPSTIVKMALGCFGVALANLILVLAAWHSGADKASWLWLLAFFAVITIGELYISPIGLSLVTKIAPGRLVSMLMGIWLATSFVGNFISGWLGSFWSAMDKSLFFMMIAAIATFAGIVIWSFDRILKPILKE